MHTRKKAFHIALTSAQIMALGFAALILTGALLLTLPAASANGESVGFPDALFTSTSATCVTGLVVLDTATAYSTFGQVIILLLIQVGGLGFMTAATLFFMLVRKKITLGERLLIQEAMNENRIGGLVRLIRWVLASSITIELIGAMFLSFRFVPLFGLGKGMFYAIFHAVSAFCNAGFDLMGGYQSLSGFRIDPLVNFTIMLLIVLGGLGFGVLSDVWNVRRFKNMHLHTKLVLTSTAVALLVGALFILAAEWSNPGTLGALNPVQKAMAALFQSVTLRTAGFATVSQAALRPATKLVSIIFMFIGASPASTGGGMKLTTMAILFLTVRMVTKGRTEVSAFGRTISRALVQRAMAIVLIGISVLTVDVIAISLLESDLDFLNLAFESASALGTVGLSADGSYALSYPSRYLIILTMFIGRVGPMTLTLALGRRQANTKESIHYPEERVLIG